MEVITSLGLWSYGVVIVVLGSSVVGWVDGLFDLPQEVSVMGIIANNNIKNFFKATAYLFFNINLHLG